MWLRDLLRKFPHSTSTPQFFSGNKQAGKSCLFLGCLWDACAPQCLSSFGLALAVHANPWHCTMSCTGSSQSAFEWDQFCFLYAVAALSLEALQHTLLLTLGIFYLFTSLFFDPFFLCRCWVCAYCMQPAKRCCSPSCPVVDTDDKLVLHLEGCGEAVMRTAALALPVC